MNWALGLEKDFQFLGLPLSPSQNDTVVSGAGHGGGLSLPLAAPTPPQGSTRVYPAIHTKEVLSAPPPLVQALPCPSTRARLTVVFLDFSNHRCYGQKRGVIGFCFDCRGKGELDHASCSSSCSCQRSTCNSNPMLSVSLCFFAMAYVAILTMPPKLAPEANHVQLCKMRCKARKGFYSTALDARDGLEHAEITSKRGC